MTKERCVGFGSAYQAGLREPYSPVIPPIAGLPGSVARKQFRAGQLDGRKQFSEVANRSSRPEVRNPLLAIPAMQELYALDAESRAAIRAVLLNIRLYAQDRAEHCWRKGKPPMAAYWKTIAVFAGHIARAIR